MDLYIVRHAIAAARDVGKWPDDSRRPLTDRGVTRFRQAAQGLRRLVPSVDIVLSSPYTRAWDTSGLLHEEAGWPSPIECEQLEAERRPIEGVEALGAHAGRASVGLVGHEPNLSELASLLLGMDPGRLRLKKGGAVCLQILGDAASGAASLLWLVTPKILRLLADE